MPRRRIKRLFPIAVSMASVCECTPFQVLLHRDTSIDIVFSDIEIPGSVDGSGLASWIRELT